MIVIRSKSGTAWTLVPVLESEKVAIAALSSLLKVGDKLSYDGMRRIGPDKKIPLLTFYLGGVREKVSVTTGSVTIIQSVNVGGTVFEISGATDEDHREVLEMRNACFYGSGELVFLREDTFDGEQALVVTPMFCKVCGEEIADLASVEWATCGACALKCEHTFVFNIREELESYPTSQCCIAAKITSKST